MTGPSVKFLLPLLFVVIHLFSFIFFLKNPKIFKYKQPWLCFTWGWNSKTRLHNCTASNSFQTQNIILPAFWCQGIGPKSFKEVTLQEALWLDISASFNLFQLYINSPTPATALTYTTFVKKKWHPSAPSCLFSSLLSPIFLIQGLRRSMIFPLITRPNFCYTGLQFIKQTLHSCHNMYL